MPKRLVTAVNYVAFVRKARGGFHFRFPDAPECEGTVDGAELLYAHAKKTLDSCLRAQLARDEVPSTPRAHRSPEANERRMHVEVSAGLVVAVLVREMRLEKGWTQADLAKLLRVSQQQVAKLEDPDATRTEEMIAKIKRIASAHGVALPIAFE